MDEKRQLRKEMMASLKSIRGPLYKELSGKIASRLFELPEWKKARVLGITISRPPEVDTYGIITRAWSEGKKVAVPKCLPAEKKMEFRYLTDFAELEKVYFGLLEPIPAETELSGPTDIDFLIVPGLAYAENGYRLGFGGGYYDRFLPHYKGETAALAFSSQIVGNLPVEGHDIPLARIITDEKVIIP